MCVRVRVRVCVCVCVLGKYSCRQDPQEKPKLKEPHRREPVPRDCCTALSGVWTTPANTLGRSAEPPSGPAAPSPASWDPGEDSCQ